jgi:transcriptional regulator with XRE-family HTH domain
MNLREIFINNLKKYRKLRGVSQTKLAHLCDSSTSYIGQIEIGNKFPSINMIAKIAKALEIKPYILFFDESEEGSQAALPPKLYVMPETIKEDLIRQLTAAVRRIVKKQ